VRAIVALVEGKVKTTLSVPAKVSELLTVSTLPFEIVIVPVVVVIVNPLIVPGRTNPEGIDKVQVITVIDTQVPVAVISLLVPAIVTLVTFPELVPLSLYQDPPIHPQRFPPELGFH